MMPLLSNHWFRLFLAVTLLVLVFLAGTPILIKHLAQQWLLENGGEQVQVKNVDFNPFTATLLMEGCQVQVNSETTLSFESVGLDVAWRPLFGKQIRVQSVSLTGLDITIDDRAEDAIVLGGLFFPKATKVEPGQPEQKSAWASGIEMLTLNDVHIFLLDDKLSTDIIIEQLELEGLSQWSPEQMTPLSAAGSVNHAAFRLNGNLAPLADNPSYQFNLSLQQLPLDMFETLAASAVQRLGGRLSFDGNLTLRQNGGVFSLSEDGDIRLEALDVAMARPDLDIRNGALSVSGSLDFRQTGSEQSIELDSNITLNDINIVARESKLELFIAETLNLDNLRLRGLDTISIDKLTTTKFGIGHSADDPQQDAFQYAEKLEISAFAFSEQLVSIDTVSYEGGHSNIRREADGKLRIVSILETIKGLTAAPDEETPAPDSDGTTRPLAFSIASIRVDENSKISFSDNSVEPPFKMVVNFEKGTLDNLDTRKPDQASQVDISAVTDRHTRLSLNGSVKPFLETPGVNLTGKIEAMGLPAISSYTRESLGLIMDSGSLNADLTMTSKDKVLDGKAELKIHQLVFKNVESENSLQSRIPVPLNVALDTLRDRNNTIELEIPISGDASSPDFDINDAISQALAGGVSKGALTYLKFALQPYGALITAAQYAGETITKVRLDPVTFEAGQSKLTDSHRDYLTKLAGMMKDRPSLAIKVCGVAAPADNTYYIEMDRQKKKDSKQEIADKPVTDKPATDYTPQLTALAKQRAVSVRDYLVITHQTPASRLVECQPRITSDQTETEPRTDLLI